jgi:alcohol dehydrogenase (cytochrome c)
MLRHAALLLGAVSAASGQVTFDRILNAAREPQNWLTYSGTMRSQRHSSLSQIDTANAKNLEMQTIYTRIRW